MKKVEQTYYLPSSKSIATKWLAHIVLIACFGLFATAVEGQSVVGKKVALHLKNVSMREAFSEIQKQSGVRFIYDEDIHKYHDKKISLTLEDADINEAVKRVLQGTNLTYTFKDGYVTIKEGQARHTLSGRVTGAGTQGSIAGATVRLMELGKDVATNAQGGYQFKDLPTGRYTLEVSMLGHAPYSAYVDLREGAEVVRNIQLADTAAQALDEVVVVGYGTLQRKHVTSSISSVKADDLPRGMGGSSIEMVLRGKVAGLTVNTNSSPNAANSIQLRGIASVNAGQSPLVVIDGMPGGDIRSLNQEEIESIDVLKDASAGAIYGTRAAGGVILITTKGAKEGPIKATYSGEINTEDIVRRPEMLSAEEYVERRVGEDYGGREDWYAALLRETPISHRHVLSLSGGGKYSRLYGSFMAQDQKGISIGDARKDYSGRINADFSLWDGKFDIKARTEYRRANRDERHSSGIYRMAMRMNPTVAIYDPNDPSGYNVNNDIGVEEFNPVADVNLRTRGGTDSWLLADVMASLKLTDDFKLVATLGTQERQWQYNNYVSAYHNESVRANRRGTADIGYNKRWDQSTETYLSYDKYFSGHHSVNAVAGYSFYQTDNISHSMTNYDFAVDGLGPWDIGSGTYLSDGKAAMASNRKPRERLQSFFGRVNYAFQDKYLATFSLRHEGSSKFGPENRWGTFWAISGGWNIHRESFMQHVSFLNELKVRVGYGVTGNNDFTPGQTVRMYSANGWWTNGDQWGLVYGSKHNVNRGLKWEEKAELNVGLDYALLNSRLFGKFDIYRRNVSDMLYQITVAQPPAVHDKMMSNIGNLKNSGWELEIGGIPVQKKNFSYTTSLRLSHNKTTIESIGNVGFLDVSGGNFPSPGNPGNPFRLENGVEIGQFFMKKHAGIDEDGQFLVYDENDQVVLATKAGNESRRYLGNAMPRLYASWDHSIAYRNWDLALFFRSHINFDVLNMADMYYGLPSRDQGNVLKKAISPDREAIKGEKELSDYWLEDGTFLKLDAAVIGYTWKPKTQSRYFDNLRVYVSSRDLFTITGYTGKDPEVDTNGLLPGVDWINKDSLYPKTRRFTLGVQVQF